ncbi:hypothetical protein B0G73_12888 [Paraburkholderia sp. BL25I1N1]|nr:hypothetical protein B0G73_12888 [Paraburkholderia sp. BL25I1N1]
MATGAALTTFDRIFSLVKLNFISMLRMAVEAGKWGADAGPLCVSQ